MKVLLIEDEKELAKSIQSYLSDNDFICEWVYTVVEALEKSHHMNMIVYYLTFPYLMVTALRYWKI